MKWWAKPALGQADAHTAPLWAEQLCSHHDPTLQARFMIRSPAAMIHLTENNSSLVELARKISQTWGTAWRQVELSNLEILKTPPQMSFQI